MVSDVFPESTLVFQEASPSLALKSYLCICSDMVRFGKVFDPLIQQCVLDNFTSHIAQSMLSVHSSTDCDIGGTTSSISNDCPQHVQAQHKMTSLELIHLQTSAPVHEGLEQQLDEVATLTFFTSAPTDLIGLWQ